MRGVLVSPGEVFSAARGPGRRHVRICIGNPATGNAVTKGLEILRDLLADGATTPQPSIL